MLASPLSRIAVLLLLVLSSVVVGATAAAPSNCLPSAPFNVSLDRDFQLQSDINFSPFSCSLLLLTPPYTVVALSSITGQPLYHWPFPVDNNYSFPSDGFHLSATNDRLYTLTYSTDPAYDEACTNVIALSTAAGKVAWVQSICVTPAEGAEPYAGGDYVVVGNMTRAASGGMVDYVVHISSSTSLDHHTGQPVNENYSMAVYESEAGAVLSVFTLGVKIPLQATLLSVRDDGSALLLLVVGSSETEVVSELLYSLDRSGQLTFIRNTSVDADKDWEQRYQSSTMVYTTPTDCFDDCTYIGIDVVSGKRLWQVRDARLDGVHWFNTTALPGYTDNNGAVWWPSPRDSSPCFLSSSLLWVTNQATKPHPSDNRTLLVAQHAIYDLRTGNYTALSELLGPVEGDVGDRDIDAGTELTSSGQPVLELNNDYVILDAATLAVVERGKLPSDFDGVRYIDLEEWRGVDDTWIWSVSIEDGPQWVAATQVKRGAAVELAAPAAVFER